MVDRDAPLGRGGGSGRYVRRPLPTRRADRVGEGDHPPALLVPQRVARRTQPIEQGQYRRRREAWMRTVAGF